MGWAHFQQASGTLQPAIHRVAPSHTGYVCDSSNSSIMVDVLRGDLLPTTANIELPKSQLHRTRGQLSFKDRSQRSSLVELRRSGGLTERAEALSEKPA